MSKKANCQGVTDAIGFRAEMPRHGSNSNSSNLISGVPSTSTRLLVIDWTRTQQTYRLDQVQHRRLPIDDATIDTPIKQRSQVKTNKAAK